jgi:DDE domain
VDETHIRVKGKWAYLYRAVDSAGASIDFLLSAQRDAAPAKRFFQKALRSPNHPTPQVINVDKNPSYPPVVEALKAEGTMRRRCRLRPMQYLNDILEQRSSGHQVAREGEPRVSFVPGSLPHDPRFRSGACDSEGANQMGGGAVKLSANSSSSPGCSRFQPDATPASMPLLCRHLKVATLPMKSMDRRFALYRGGRGENGPG